MTNRMKLTVSLLSLVMSVGVSAGSAQAQTDASRLQVYAGPQTTIPGENISVTIEMTDGHGKSVQGETVQLTYVSDSVPKLLSGKISNGLMSFDVSAQSIAGGMTFQATSGDLTSNSARVQIVATQPDTFKLEVRSSNNVNLVDITTDSISDAFGNLISDQSLVALSWVDNTGVKRSEAAQLSNGRIIYTSICPGEYAAPLKIRAVLKNVEVFSSDLSVLCASREVGA
ncbi:MAG: hypothetical protein ABJO36_07625 [Litorimonas sp.]